MVSDEECESHKQTKMKDRIVTKKVCTIDMTVGVTWRTEYHLRRGSSTCRWK